MEVETITATGGAALSTDREIWREVEDDYYSPSLSVTRNGDLVVNVGGLCVQTDIRHLHDLLLGKVAAKGPVASFPAGVYPGSLGQLELSRSERYNTISYTPTAFETALRKYTWYFLPDGIFDGTSGELEEPLDG